MNDWLIFALGFIAFPAVLALLFVVLGARIAGTLEIRWPPWGKDKDGT